MILAHASQPRRRRLSVLLLASLSLLAVEAPAAGPDDVDERLDALLAAAMTGPRLPSLSVAVARDGKLLHARAAGLADLENAVPATPRTVYGVGSVTKVVTAVAALRLAERGRLDLDAPVQRYCPAFPPKEQPTTVRLLLAHLGGIRGYDHARPEDFLNRTSYDSLAAGLVKFADDPLVAPPGTRYLYSSWGYVLVGCAIEGASGESYETFVRREVLAPAGVRQAFFDRTGPLVPFRARRYAVGDDGAWRHAVFFDASDRSSAGALLTTPGDLARLGSALLAGELLGAESLRLMFASGTTGDGESTGYGLGFNVSEDGAEVFHGGTSVGATAFLYLRPRDRLVVAFATSVFAPEGRLELARQLAELVTAPAPAPP